MKERILQLRAEGKSYNQIVSELGCSKSTVAYHCGDGQKKKTRTRTQKYRTQNPLMGKVDNFKSNPKGKRNLVERVRKFQKRDNNVTGLVNSEMSATFHWRDVIDKFGLETECYLTGEKLHLFKDSEKYNLDHINPASRTGDNSLDNMGIAHTVANYMKGDLTPEELFGWCIKILEHNGYTITK